MDEFFFQNIVGSFKPYNLNGDKQLVLHHETMDEFLWDAMPSAGIAAEQQVLVRWIWEPKPVWKLIAGENTNENSIQWSAYFR